MSAERETLPAHFTTAAELLQQCGLTAETIRAEWGQTLLEAGDDPAAIIPALAASIIVAMIQARVREANAEKLRRAS